MNIEEKAIEVLKHCKDRNFSAFDKIYFDDETNMCVYKAIETLLTAYEKEKEERERIGKLYYEANENCIKYEKIIEKQSKEIEELKQEKEYLNCIIESDKDNYINKDKIKAKIEEYKKQQKEEPDAYLCIKVLSSLLEKE